MRIVYGVFGYGRGHATRALGVLPQLARRHELLVFAGGTAYEMLVKHHPVVRIPTLSYAYGEKGTLSAWLTVQRNLSRVADVLFSGSGFRDVLDTMRDFQPDLAICDVDPWTHQAAARLGVPRISFDHYGILAYCRPPIPSGDRLRHARDRLAYRLLTGRPDRIVVSSFYDAPAMRPDVRFVGPLLRDAVLRARPRRGEHLLAYFNQPELLTPRVEEALHALGLPVLAYGTGRSGRTGPLEFRPPADQAFLDDLAGCRAVVGTAGNQLVGEALYLGKPMLVMPEDSVEQRLNAAAVERLGIGLHTSRDRFSLSILRQFLDGAHTFSEISRARARDGRAQAIAALEAFSRELTDGRAVAVPRRSYA